MAAPPSLPAVQAQGAATWLRLAVQPNAKRTRLDGLHDGALRLRLAAPPVDGKANEVLVAWLADELDLPRRAVRLLQGQASRRKLVEVALDEAAVRRWLRGQGVDGDGEGFARQSSP